MRWLWGFDSEYLYMEYKMKQSHVTALAWLDKLTRSQKAITVQHNGKDFYWVHYDAFSRDCMILDIKKKMVANLFKYCCDAGVLEHHTATFIPNHIPGKYSMYRFKDGVLDKIKPPYKPRNHQ